MRLPKRGERGFTLIELLIVVAILGVLAAVIIPNVTRFVGAGEEEAAETELHNVQLAVTSMMLENGLTTIPGALSAGLTVPVTNHENKMWLFPSMALIGTDPAINKVSDPAGVLYDDAAATPDEPGYILYGHDINAKDLQVQPLVNYVTADTTTYYYTCEPDGTVQQWDIGGNVPVW